MIDLLSHYYVFTVLAWISAIPVLFKWFMWVVKKKQKNSLNKIGKRIKFIEEHKTDIKRLEYGILSILQVFGIFSTIFLFEFAFRNEADREVGRYFQFIIATITYCMCIYRSSNFSDLVNAKEILIKLNKQKKELETKLN